MSRVNPSSAPSVREFAKSVIDIHNGRPDVDKWTMVRNGQNIKIRNSKKYGAYRPVYALITLMDTPFGPSFRIIGNFGKDRSHVLHGVEEVFWTTDPKWGEVYVWQVASYRHRPPPWHGVDYAEFFGESRDLSEFFDPEE